MDSFYIVCGAVDALQSEPLDTNTQEVFDTFDNLCLVQFYNSMNWRYKAHVTSTSDIFTILLLENNVDDYEKTIKEKRNLMLKEAKA